MSEYVYRPKGSYGRYLQTKSFVDDIRWDISESALRVSASVDALRESGARIESAVTTGLAKTRRSVEGGLTQVGDKVDRLGGMVENIDETLRVGIDQLGGKLDQVDDALREGFDFLGGRIDEVDETLRTGFVRLHFDVTEVNSSLKDMSAKFDFGFGILNTRLGSINDTLDALKLIAQNPEQTWAFEQYRIAHDAYGRGLFNESLTYVTRAIDGHQSHTGYLLEHRFHYLFGVLRLGDKNNNSAPVADPSIAETAFLSAARYAKGKYNDDASRALCSAGYAAYAQGKMDAATKYTVQALQLKDDLPQGHFQLAKICFHNNDSVRGLNSLKRAISLDKLYAVKCFADHDFLEHEGKISDLIHKMALELSRLCADRLKTFNGIIGQVDAIIAKGCEQLNFIDVRDQQSVRAELINLQDYISKLSTISLRSVVEITYMDSVTVMENTDDVMEAIKRLISRAHAGVISTSNRLEDLIKTSNRTVPICDFKFNSSALSYETPAQLYKLIFTAVFVIVTIAAFALYDHSFFSFLRNTGVVIVVGVVYLAAMSWVDTTNLFYSKFQERVKSAELEQRAAHKARLDQRSVEIERENEAAQLKARELTASVAGVLSGMLHDFAGVAASDSLQRSLVHEARELKIIY